MTKHIIIAGVPRAGKSTVSKILSATGRYQHISMDSIIAGIEKVFPEVGIDSDRKGNVEGNIRNISRRIAPFIQAMIDSGEYDECEYGMVIDVCQLLPEDYITYIDASACSVFYFITSDVSTMERFEILIANDTPNDYSYYETNENKIALCEDIVLMSHIMKKQCLQYGVPFYETAKDRARSLQVFLQTLEDQQE